MPRSRTVLSGSGRAPGCPSHHFPLAETAKAHAAVEQGVTGKVLIGVADL